MAKERIKRRVEERNLSAGFESVGFYFQRVWLAGENKGIIRLNADHGKTEKIPGVVFVV